MVKSSTIRYPLSTNTHQTMKKQNFSDKNYSQEFLNEKHDVKKKTTNGHVQLTGEMIMDMKEPQSALFVPAEPVERGELAYRQAQGKSTWYPDGTFEFVKQKPRSHKSQAKLIKKLPYGRLSETKLGKIQYTLLLDADDPESAWNLLTNSIFAAFALQDYLPCLSVSKLLPSFINISRLASNKHARGTGN